MALADIGSLDETAAYLTITPAALLALHRARKIGSLKQGHKITFPRAVVEAYIETYTVAAAPANPHGLTDRALANVRKNAATRKAAA